MKRRDVVEALQIAAFPVMFILFAFVVFAAR